MTCEEEKLVTLSSCDIEFIITEILKRLKSFLKKNENLKTLFVANDGDSENSANMINMGNVQNITCIEMDIV